MKYFQSFKNWVMKPDISIGQRLTTFLTDNKWPWYLLLGLFLIVFAYGRGLRVGFEQGAIKQRAYDEMDSERVAYYVSIRPDTADILWPHVGFETNYSRKMFEDFADNDSSALAIIIKRAGLIDSTVIVKSVLDTGGLVTNSYNFN